MVEVVLCFFVGNQVVIIWVFVGNDGVFEKLSIKCIKNMEIFVQVSGNILIKFCRKVNSD